MKGDRLKPFAWLITNGFITRPSDKLAVIDLELETYAPAADGSGFHRFLSFFFELWNGV